MKRSVSFGLGAVSALALSAFVAISPITFNDEFFERVDGVVRLGPLFGMYYAKNYGPCSNGDLSDMGACINAAYSVVQANVVSAAGFLYGGGKIIVPAGRYNISTTALQTAKTGVGVRGAGGPGAYGVCGTQLDWTGAAGGTMMQFGSDAIATIVVGGGLEAICLDGKSLAATGLKLLSASWGDYHVFVTNTTTDGIFQDVSATDVAGSSKNKIRAFISQISAGAINANGFRQGVGTATNDSWGNDYDVHTQTQNGDGFICGNSDTNYVRLFNQIVMGGSGRGLRLQGGQLGAAGPFNLSECRENKFEGAFGASGFPNSAAIAEAGPVVATGTASISGTTLTVSVTATGTFMVGQSVYGPNISIPTRITADLGGGSFTVNASQTAASGSITASYPSFHNEIKSMAAGSGFPNPVIVTPATLTWENDVGERFSNHTTSLGNGVPSRWVQGGMAYRASGTNNAVFDIDTANSTNFATAGKFGPSLPLYLHYNSPVLGLNAYWGGAWKFGKGSSSNYGGTLGYGATTGTLTFSGAQATGNADANITLTNLWAIDRFGHERASGMPAPTLSSCGTSPTISGDDRAGEVTMGTGSPTGCVIAFANVHVAAPYCVVTWQANLASMGYTVNVSAITVTQTATSANKINYRCTARSGG